MKKVLFIATSHDKLGDSELSTGCYFPEVIMAYKKFTEEGLEVDFASPKGGKIPLTGFNEYDVLTRSFLENSEFMKKIKHSYKISEITKTKGNLVFPSNESFQLKEFKIDDYMAIYIAGGHGAMWDMPDNNHLQSIISEFYESGGVIGAVCNAPAALVNVKLSTGEYLIKGKKITCISNEEEKFINMIRHIPFLLETKIVKNGGMFSSTITNLPHVEVGERLITGQNSISSEVIAIEMLNLMKVGAVKK